MTDTRIPYQQVLEAVRAYMQKCGQEEGPQVSRALARMGAGQEYFRSARFIGQVSRALEALTKEGILIKVGRGKRHPNGTRHPVIYFYTSGRFAEETAKADCKRAERDTASARWEQIYDDLARRGFINRGNRGQSILLAEEDWDRILDALAVVNNIFADRNIQ